MAEVKLTKGELKRQRDALQQFQRYLPMLQLKKQQLQIEILEQASIITQKKLEARIKLEAVQAWAGLLTEKGVDLSPWVKPSQVITQVKNIAGVDIPFFERTEFRPAEYDLFLTPAWVDKAIEFLRQLSSVRAEIAILEELLAVLKQELRITTQRVNLFEKVKIPEAQENIRLIKIFIGDQLSNAVGRSKIAKRKIQAQEEVLV